jgi:hypothetical protein
MRIKSTVPMLLVIATLATADKAVLADGAWISDRDQPITFLQPPHDIGPARSEPQANLDAMETELRTGGDNSDANSFVANGGEDLTICDCAEPTCGDVCENPPACITCNDQRARRRINADVELMALRAHFGEEAVGKLAEKYELSERFVLGLENPTGTGGRIRYWTYDRTTPNLQGGTDIRFDFDVVDFEGTSHIRIKNFDIVIAGGARWADIKIDTDGGRSRNDMPGATVAADLTGLICRDCNLGLEWRSVTGIRWSIFGGDWEGGATGLIEPTRDDNIIVQEIYGGVECVCHRCGHDMYARLVMEAQNWRSDALGENTDVDSLGFIGPGLNLGMNF